MACGDNFDEEAIRLLASEADRQLAPTEVMYCQECGDEKFRNAISTRPARLFSTGRGCPLEPGSESSPGQDNAIRRMET